MSQQPSLARMVLTYVDPLMNNGSNVAPAVITRVWGEHPEGGWTVNLRAFCDAATMPLSLTSVRLFDEQPATHSIGAWWPPRV